MVARADSPLSSYSSGLLDCFLHSLLSSVSKENREKSERSSAEGRASEALSSVLRDQTEERKSECKKLVLASLSKY